jgi:undecaprenyl-diphosphatase
MWTSADTVRLVTAVAVFALSTTLALSGTSSFEEAVFTTINDSPDWLYAPVWVVMQLGAIGVACAVGLVVALGLRRPALAAVFVAAPLLAWSAARVVKAVVERGRPADEGLTVIVRGTVQSGHGFVSGHSAVAFALATVIAPHLLGRWRLVPFVLATVVALGRVYVGAHLPLDVIGGAALGVAVGEVVRAVETAVRVRLAAR